MSSTPVEPESSPPALDQLLRDLNSRKAAVHREAMRRARALPPEALLQLAQMEAKRYRKRWWSIHLLVFGLVAACGVTMTLYYLLGKQQTDPDTLWFLLFSLPLIAVLSILNRFVPTRAHRSIARLIEQNSDVRFLSILLSMLKEITWEVGWAPDPIIYRHTYNVLRRLVREIGNGNPRHIPVKERNQALLYVLATPYRDVDLTLSVLKALEQISDESLIPAVEKLAKEQPATREAKEIQEAAHECLSFLRLHAEDVKQSQTLLRASNSSTTDEADNLLRPITNTENVLLPEQLLRAANPSETQVSETLSTLQAKTDHTSRQEQWLHASKEEKP